MVGGLLSPLGLVVNGNLLSGLPEILDGADHPLDVVGVDLPGRFGIDLLQHGVHPEIARAAGQRFQLCADRTALLVLLEVDVVQQRLDIKSGEHIAFVGPSGGGKSTLAKLIARFADVNSGFIEIGGVNVKNIKASDLMNTVSFVFQDSKLLKMSIFDNVRMGNKNATREEVIEALHNAQCDDIIEKLPGGIDTVIGSKGTYLSGGETQRIAIARAMLKNAPILILDEATAFADPDNEAKVQAAFSKLSEGKTVIMIAHRLSSVTEVDRIYVLKNGQICQSGTHENLLSQDGLYAHMWKEFNKSVSWKVGA